MHIIQLIGLNTQSLGTFNDRDPEENIYQLIKIGTRLIQTSTR